MFEAEDQVGGIAKTEVRDGYRFDLGGHRFFTKSKEVDDLWHEVMKEEFLRRPRMSRIYWRGKFLDYPLNGQDVIKKLGPVELARCLASYLWAAITPKGREENLEQWVSNRFGKRLYQHFFMSYTEKVWGVPASEVRAEWAAQRIKGLSFFSAAKAAFFGNKDNKIKSLINEFHYPRFGPGQMWETMADEIIANGGEVRLNTPVTSIEVRDGRVVALEAGGERIEPSEVISSLPLRATVGMSGAAAPGTVQAAAQGLRYRDFLTIALVIDGEDLFPDNWIYIHEPGRARSAGSRTSAPGARGWSRTSPRPRSAWSTSASRATSCGSPPTRISSSSASARSNSSGWPRPQRSSAGSSPGCRRRTRCTTPTTPSASPRSARGSRASANLQQVGRNGLHRYNNSDHSMLTAMRAVENVIAGTKHDLWAVNAESAYHEEHQEPEQPYRRVPSTQYEREPLHTPSEAAA